MKLTSHSAGHHPPWGLEKKQKVRKNRERDRERARERERKKERTKKEIKKKSCIHNQYPIQRFKM